MTRDARITCAICAWRQDCQKKFTVTNALHCREFTRDVSIKDVVHDKAKKQFDGERGGSDK